MNLPDGYTLMNTDGVAWIARPNENGNHNVAHVQEDGTISFYPVATDEERAELLAAGLMEADL